MQAPHAQVTRMLKTARGQLDGILKMVEEDRYCVDISHQLIACQALLRRINEEVLSSHMKRCVRETLTSGQSEDADQKIEELITLFGKMSK